MKNEPVSALLELAGSRAEASAVQLEAFEPRPRRVGTPCGLARVAIVFCPGFQPHGWRDIPEGGEIVALLEPMSLGAARERAKAFNRCKAVLRVANDTGDAPQDRGDVFAAVDTWALVVANDGRKAARG